MPSIHSTNFPPSPPLSPPLSPPYPPPAAGPEAASSPARLLLAEDDPPIARALVRAFDRGGIVTTWFADGGQADLALAAPDSRFDAAVLDIGLPGRDGIEVLKRIRERGDPLPVLLLTARDDMADRVYGLDAGADDYLIKPFEMTELEARVRALLRRGRYNGASGTNGAGSDLATSLRHGRFTQASGEAGLRLDGRPMDLTPREAGVLAALLRRVGRVASKSIVLQDLALADPSAMDLNDSAIEVIVHRLRRKIEGCGIEIHTVRGFGYLLRDAGG